MLEFSFFAGAATNKKHLYNQARKAMYSVLRKSKKLGLTIDLQLQLFDNLVTPILLYGAEIWGCGNNDIIEKLHLKYCRMLLRVNNSTSKCMVYGELGRFPLQTFINQRMLNYWARMIQSDDHRLNKRLYQITYTLCKQRQFESEWISHIKQTLNSCNLYQCWLAQRIHVPSINIFKGVVNKVTCDTYKAEWQESVYSNQKCYNYRMFKREFCFESYLIRLPVSLRIVFAKFRLSNHNLPIEKGRHWNIERCERKCTQCNVLGDEFHYLFICPLFSDDRKLFLTKGYQRNINADKYYTLFSSKNYQKLCKLTKFIKIIMNELKN